MKKSKIFNKLFFGIIFGFMTILPLSVNASEKEFINAYFKDGKLEIPDVPYIKETNFDNTDMQLGLYYYKTSDLQKLALDIQKQGEEELLKNYGDISQLSVFIQIDTKFNDGDWLSSKGTWNKIDSNGNINYGENIREWDLTFLSVGENTADNANKLLNFTQSWLTYFDLDSDVNEFLKQNVKALKNEDDQNYYVFDFKKTTVTYRIRWCVKFLQDEYKESQKYVLLTSDWSKETSIGKNGKQEKIKMPEKLDAPVLSEFELVVNDDGYGEIKYFFSLPDSIYQAEKYRLIKEDAFEPYIIESQVKINDGNWNDINIANATWLTNGYRAASLSELKKLSKDDDAYLRVRIVSTNDESEHSEWSNIIGTKKLDGGNEKHDNSKTVAEKAKCKLCGICPFQPLGICLFVWLALFILLIIIIIVLIKKAKNNKKKKQEKNKNNSIQ